MIFDMDGTLVLGSAHGAGFKPLPGAVAQYAGDLCLVFALALALTTPWTKGQREAMWRKRLYRLRRRAADVARVS